MGWLGGGVRGCVLVGDGGECRSTTTAVAGSTLLLLVLRLLLDALLSRCSFETARRRVTCWASRGTEMRRRIVRVLRSPEPLTLRDLPRALPLGVTVEKMMHETNLHFKHKLNIYMHSITSASHSIRSNTALLSTLVIKSITAIAHLRSSNQFRQLPTFKLNHGNSPFSQSISKFSDKHLYQVWSRCGYDFWKHAGLLNQPC